MTEKVKIKTILVVEDDPSSLFLLEELLEPMEINLLTATSGKETLQLVASEPVDLIFLDIKLGDTNGFVLLPKIKKLNPNVKVIAQTAFAYQEDINNCISSGFTDYLSKPIHSGRLMHMLEKYLQLR